MNSTAEMWQRPVIEVLERALQGALQLVRQRVDPVEPALDAGQVVDRPLLQRVESPREIGDGFAESGVLLTQVRDGARAGFQGELHIVSRKGLGEALALGLLLALG